MLVGGVLPPRRGNKVADGGVHVGEAARIGSVGGQRPPIPERTAADTAGAFRPGLNWDTLK